jgi:predicted double-glycine peptidase
MRHRFLVCLVVTGTFILGGAWGQFDQAQPVADARYAEFRGAAIQIPLPEVQQPDDYSCGAAALMSILSYYGVGTEDYDVLKKRLDTNKKRGTEYTKMIAYAEEVGLKTRVWKWMESGQLAKCLQERHPVICSIQAYEPKPEKTPEVYYDENKNGHYVVAIGLDEQNYYFMDPSLIGRRGFLPKIEFVKRWHDEEGKRKHPKVLTHLGLEIWKEGGASAYDHRARRID